MKSCFILYDIAITILEQMKSSKEQVNCFLLGFFSSCREVDKNFHKELIYIRILIEAFKHVLCYFNKVCGIVR